MKSHLERDGNGRMELQGIGDPSGRGEGYSFVRIASAGIFIFYKCLSFVALADELAD